MRAPTHEEFYASVGSALTAWSKVEEAFRDLFIRIVACAVTGAGMGKVHNDGFWILGDAFYASTNFAARRALIGRSLRKLVNDEALIAEWNAVNNRAGELYKRRNVLAHGQAWSGSGEPLETLRSSIFDQANRRKMTYHQICAQTPSFEQFSKRVEALAIAVNAYLAEHPRPN